MVKRKHGLDIGTDRLNATANIYEGYAGGGSREAGGQSVRFDRKACEIVNDRSVVPNNRPVRVSKEMTRYTVICRVWRVVVSPLSCRADRRHVSYQILQYAVKGAG